MRKWVLAFVLVISLGAGIVGLTPPSGGSTAWENGVGG